MKQGFMKVTMGMQTVVPQCMVELAGARLLGDLVEGVAGGELPATLEIETASPGVRLADVSDYMKGRWLDWLAADAVKVKEAKAELKTLELDDDNCLLAPFLVWDRGTPFADVAAWFK